MSFAKILKGNDCHSPDTGRFCSKATFKKTSSGYDVLSGGTKLGTIRRGDLRGHSRLDRGPGSWVVEMDVQGERVAFEAYDFSSAKAQVNEELYRRRPKPVRPVFSPEDLIDD